MLNMTVLALLLFTATAYAQTVRFGSHFTTANCSSHIVEATTTLVPGPVPYPPQDLLALWPGMISVRGVLTQSIAVAFLNPAVSPGL